MVEQYFALGNATITMVLDCNPTTQKVEKAVRMLTVSGTLDKRLLASFQEEASTGSFAEK